MFGYIMPDKPEMKIREYELFRAYYCGICRSIGKRYGQLERFTLNYDCTFLAVLLSSISDEKVNVTRTRCAVRPFTERIIVDNNSIIDYASDINIILAYFNAEDKKRDDGKIKYGAAMKLLGRSYRKLKSKYCDQCMAIEKSLNDLIMLEAEKCASMDMAAEPFAKLMEEVTAYRPLCSDENTEKTLRWLGYNLGKWIYLLDAYDDIEKDIKEKNYNPLLYQFNYDGMDVAEFKKKIRQKVEFNLTYSLKEVARAFELLDVKSNRSILDNIIYLGILRKTEKILNAGSCKEIEQSV
jgi:hypothetical protein